MRCRILLAGGKRRLVIAVHPDDIAFRDRTNDELSKIFYADAAKKGKY